MIPKTLVSDNGPEFGSVDLIQWCESQRILKNVITIYNPRADGNFERTIQTVKWAIKAWSLYLNVSFGVLLQWILMTHRNTAKTPGKLPLELLLGRKVRLPEVRDIDLFEAVLSKTMSISPTVPATFIIRKRMNTSFIQPENTNKTLLVSENQIMGPDNIKTESIDQQLTDSQSEPQYGRGITQLQ